MTADLSFFDYQRKIVAGYDSNNGEDVHHFSELNETDFYRLSFQHRMTFELEYQLLEKLLKTNDLPAHLKPRVEYYLECCAHFLLRDAQIAENTAESIKYQDTINTFAQRRVIPAVVTIPATETEFRQSLNQFYQDFNGFLATRFHVSKVITLLSYINLYRLLTLFSRLSLKSFWTLAQDNKWLDVNNHLFGQPINRSILDNTAGVFNFLSVSVFALRLTAHLSMIAKHATSQRAGEKDIDWRQRAFQEFYVRMANIMNDIVWVIINLLTNYASIWGISDPLSNLLLCCTLVYDSISLGVLWYVKEKEWHAEKVLLSNYRNSNSAFNSQDDGLTDLKLQLISDMQLEMRVKFAFSILAGLSIMTSYLLVLALASTAVATLGFSMCVVGFGMYASADDFATWMRAEFGALKIDGEKQQAKIAFLTTWAKSTLTPLFMVGLVTISWELALLAMVFVAVRPYIPKFGGSPSQTPVLENEAQTAAAFAP
ncbi:MAG: hypothetical protein CK424_00670 [Legionella sp.]|nr:MAG: hypothetical protein CK424_00670 [Legionella sp.]